MRLHILAGKRDHAVGSAAVNGAVTDDQVVEQRNVQTFHRCANRLRRGVVLRGGQGIAGGMVVDEDDRVRVLQQRLLGDHPRIDCGPVQRPAADPLCGNQHALGIQAQQQDRFAALGIEQLVYKTGDVVSAVQSDAAIAAGKAAKRHALLQIPLHVQEQGGAFANALNAAQRGDIRGEYGLKRAKAIEQRVRRGIDVAPRNGIGQEQLQQLVIRKRGSAACKIPLAQTLPVPAVWVLHAQSSRSVFSHYMEKCGPCQNLDKREIQI